MSGPQSQPRGRMRAPRILAALAVGLLTGCASLPTEETAAFRTVAASSQTSFASLSQAETDALSNDRLAQVAAHQKGLMLANGCMAEAISEAPCFLVVGDLNATDPAQGLALMPRTKRLQDLVNAISGYADGMSDLAAAKDLQAANAATGKATASLKALVNLVDPAVGAVAGPVIDGLTIAANDLAIEHRRKLMLSIAQDAQPVIDGAAKALGAETRALRGTILTLREKRLRAAKQTFDDDEAKAHPSAAADRAGLILAVANAAGDVSDARAIKTDFSPLSAAHAAIVTSLRDPKADVTASVAQAQAFLTVLRSLAAVKAPRAVS